MWTNTDFKTKEQRKEPREQSLRKNYIEGIGGKKETNNQDRKGQRSKPRQRNGKGREGENKNRMGGGEKRCYLFMIWIHIYRDSEDAPMQKF